MSARERARTQVGGKHAGLRALGHREAHLIVFCQLFERATQSNAGSCGGTYRTSSSEK